MIIPGAIIEKKCAQERIRTATSLRMPPPQSGASTNFATWALMRFEKLDMRFETKAISHFISHISILISQI